MNVLHAAGPFAGARAAVAIFALVVGGLSLLPARAPAQEASRKAASPDAPRAACVEAVRAFDADAQADFFVADGVMDRPGEPPLEGRERIRTYWTERWNGRTGRNPLDLHMAERIRAGDVAIERGSYGPEGAAPVGDFLWVLERDVARRWRIRWLTMSSR